MAFVEQGVTCWVEGCNVWKPNKKAMQWHVRNEHSFGDSLRGMGGVELHQRVTVGGSRASKHPFRNMHQRPYARFQQAHVHHEEMCIGTVHPAVTAVPPPQPMPARRYDVEGVPDPRILFRNERTFLFCQNLVKAQLSEADMAAFIATEHYTTRGCEQELLVSTPSDVEHIYNRLIDQHGLRFEEHKLHIQALNKTVSFFLRPIAALMHTLLTRPSMIGRLCLEASPMHVERGDGSIMRVYGEGISGTHMESIYDALPHNTPVAVFQESYDKTHLDLRGMLNTFPHYIAPGWLPAKERNKVGENWFAMASRPHVKKPKKKHGNRWQGHPDSAYKEANHLLRAATDQLIVNQLKPLALPGLEVQHYGQPAPVCVVCVLGCPTVLDREEVYGACQVFGNYLAVRNCTACLQKTNTFSNSQAPRSALRTVASERTRVERAKSMRAGTIPGGADGCSRLMQQFSTYARFNPLWEKPFSDPYQHTGFASLHNIWKGIVPNIMLLVWEDKITSVYGGEAETVRAAIQEWVQLHGINFPTIGEHFHEGFGNMKSWEKKDWQAFCRFMRCAFDGVFADHYITTLQGRLLEWITVAKLDVHTDDTLDLLDDLWPPVVDLAVEELGEFDPTTFAKDKWHQCGVHLVDRIKKFGNLAGQGDEAGETSHIENIKYNWRKKHNKQLNTLQVQIAHNTERRDCCRLMAEFYQYHLYQGDMATAVASGSVEDPSSWGPPNSTYVHAAKPARIVPSSYLVTLALNTDFANGSPAAQVDMLLRLLPRELREMLGGYPSVDGQAPVPMADLPNLDSMAIQMHASCHIAVPDSLVWKVQCAPTLHAKHCNFGAGSAREARRGTRSWCHHLAVKATRGVLLWMLLHP